MGCWRRSEPLRLKQWSVSRSFGDQVPETPEKQRNRETDTEKSIVEKTLSTLFRSASLFLSFSTLLFSLDRRPSILLQPQIPQTPASPTHTARIGVTECWSGGVPTTRSAQSAARGFSKTPTLRHSVTSPHCIVQRLRTHPSVVTIRHRNVHSEIQAISSVISPAGTVLAPMAEETLPEVLPGGPGGLSGGWT
jgi:hypothetical protein